MADEILTNLCEEKFGKSLKEEQRIAIESLLQRKDVLAVLPTGFGKSLIFQLFVYAKTIISKRHVSVLVISPLVSIIEDQLLEAETMGIACCSLKGINLDEMPKLAPKLIFASAEEVQGIAFQRLLKDSKSFLHTNLDLVVVDESHTVETWTGARLVRDYLLPDSSTRRSYRFKYDSSNRRVPVLYERHSRIIFKTNVNSTLCYCIIKHYRFRYTTTEPNIQHEVYKRYTYTQTYMSVSTCQLQTKQ